MMSASVAIPYLLYDDAAAALAWLERTFGCETVCRQDDEQGNLFHAEVTLGEARIMLGDPGPEEAYGPADTASHIHAMLLVYVDDVDALFTRVEPSDATVLQTLRDTDFGDRTFGVADPWGQRWYFHQKMAQG